MDVQTRAEKAARKLLSGDRASHSFDMRLDTIRPGYAEVSMVVRDDMINGHKTAHGGVVFTLADTAFACACNSHNITNVAANCQISFVRPALLGDRLLARAEEISLGRRSGVYDVRVENGDGKLVALFRGMSMSLDRPLFEEDME